VPVGLEHPGDLRADFEQPDDLWADFEQALAAR